MVTLTTTLQQQKRKKNTTTMGFFIFGIFLFFFIILISIFLQQSSTPTTTTTTTSSSLLSYHVDSDTSSNNNNNNNSTKPNILIVYTGPASTFLPSKPKVELYRLNLHYFLKYGLSSNQENYCHDAIITVGKEWYLEFYPVVQQLNQERSCGRVVLYTRRNVCYDMESVRMVFHGDVGSDYYIDNYEYFIYINCGVTGPHPSYSHNWISIYLEKLRQRDNNIHMTGLSIMCEGDNTHVQSMMYALDSMGIDLVRNIPYDCLLEESSNTKDNTPSHDFINKYERAMGRTILNAGYAISSATLQSNDQVGNYITKENRSKCKKMDMWITKHLKKMYGGRMPTLQETIFWKTSRILTPEIAKLIGYNNTDQIKWNW